MLVIGQVRDDLRQRCFFWLRVGVAGDHQRHHRVIKQHGVDLIDHRSIQARHQPPDPGNALPVAQQIEPDLMHRRIHHVSPVRLGTIRLTHHIDDRSAGQAERGEQRRPDTGVSARQIIVRREHMHPPAGRGEPGGHQKPHQRLALARGHIHYPATQHAHRSEHLHLERVQPQPTPRHLARHAEKAHELVVIVQADRRGPSRTSHQLVVGEATQRRAVGNDALDQRGVLA